MSPDLNSPELEVEALMMRLGSERYWSNVNRSKEKGSYSLQTDTGRHLMRRMVWNTMEAVDSWCDEAKNGSKNRSGFVGLAALAPMQECGTDVVALMTCKVLVDHITKPRSYASIVMQVGHKVEDELIFRQVKTQCPELFKKVVRETPKSGHEHRRARMIHAANVADLVKLVRLDRRVIIHIGQVCLNACFDASDAFVVKLNWDTVKRRHITYVNASQELLQWLEESERAHELLRPFWMPTVEEPRDWAGLHGGGYHSDILIKNPLVKFQRWRHIHDATESNYEFTARAVNVLQRVPWRVNKPVYETAAALWGAGVRSPGLPSRHEEPIPEKPADIETNVDARKAWRRSAGVTHDANVAERGRRIAVSRILEVARTYIGDREPFWFPHFCDSRGRVYPRPVFLQPQGMDLARGMLHFHEGKMLGAEGLFWLAVHGANCFGVDKVTLEERVAWVYENIEAIRAVDRDPVDARPFWEQADKPWSFLAFCCEFPDAVTEGPSFVSHLPVHVDGSNNGLQIYSLLMRDELGAKLTNVLPNPTPEDVYQDVSDQATRTLQGLAQGTGVKPLAKWKGMAHGAAVAKEAELARWLLEATGGRLPRDASKRPTMATPYGMKLFSGAKYIRAWLDTIAPEVWGGTWEMANLAAPVIWGSMGTRLTGARTAMAWLRDVARITAKADRPLHWRSPSGFGVIQDWRSQITDKIDTTVGHKLSRKRTRMRRVNMRRDGRGIATREQVDAFAPNFVHSLDASCVHRYLVGMEEVGVRALTTVHDGFATHAADAGTMGAMIRKVYADVFAEDQLENVRVQIQEETGLELPEPPEYGQLDPRVILQSRYAFS